MKLLNKADLVGVAVKVSTVESSKVDVYFVKMVVTQISNHCKVMLDEHDSSV